MNFLNPWAFAWAAILPLVVLLYFLKLKRKEVPISSTYLWRKSIEDMRVNALFQRLRRNFLLFLQLIILAAAILALTQPFLDVRGFEQTSVIVLLDRSASMGALSGDRTRLEEAKEEIREMVDDMSSGDEMALITFASSPRLVAPFTRSKAILRRAVDGVGPGEARTDIVEALGVAESLARLRQDPKVILVSDGRFPEGVDLGLKAARLYHVPVGEAVPNVGLTSLDLRRGLNMSGDVEAFVRVENFSDEPAVVTLTVSVEGKEFDAKEVELEARGFASRVFPGLGALTLVEDPERSEWLLEVRIESDEEDALPADDRAFAVLRKPEPIRVALVSDGNYFLEKALSADLEIQVAKATVGELESRGWDDLFGGFAPQVSILDRAAPETLSPGSYLIIGTMPPLEGFARGDPAEDAVVLDWDHSHPATRFVNFDNLRVKETDGLSHPAGAKILVESDGGPLILEYEAGGVRLILVGFDIYDTFSWPLQLSFPLFISNSLRHLGGDGGGESPRTVRTGEVIPLVAPGEGGEIRVEAPDGQTYRVEAEAGARAHFDKTERAGIYKVRSPDGSEEKYAVNLLDATESNLEPDEPEAPAGGEPIKTMMTLRTNREIWRPLVLAALLILLLEWYIYNRRVHL